MLIQYFKGRSPMLSACQAAAIQIANFIQMKGTDASSVLLSKAFARSFAVAAMLLQRAAKGALFPSFAVIVCAWVRLCALSRCFLAVYLPFSRLLLLLQYICPPGALSRVYVACIAAAFGLQITVFFVHPPFGDSTTRRGKGGGTAGGQAPAASVGAFYSLRSPSASRCSFSATK